MVIPLYFYIVDPLQTVAFSYFVPVQNDVYYVAVSLRINTKIKNINHIKFESDTRNLF